MGEALFSVVELGDEAHCFPKVREFLQTKAFGEPVDLNEWAMIKAISTSVAQYVTVKTFASALRGSIFGRR